MPEERGTDEARQGESSRQTLVVLIVSTTVAALIAIGAYLYVFSADNEQLDGPMPTAGSTETPPQAQQ